MAGVTGSIPVAPTIAHHNPLSEFFSLYSHDFVRVACCVPRTRVADAAYNLAETLRLAAEGDKARTAVMVFPELGLSSYAIDDLLLQDALLDAVEAAIAEVVAGVARRSSRCWSSARRCAATAGSTTAPSSSIAARSSASCRRPTCRTTASSTRSASSPPAPASSSDTIRLAGHDAPFGTDLLFRSTGTSPSPSTSRSARTSGCRCRRRPTRRSPGAEVLLNLSASNITIGKAETRRLLCASQSARASRPTSIRRPGPGESTTDLAWDGHAAIYENGDLLAETQRFPEGRPTIVTADVDLGRLRQERMRNDSFGDCAHARGRPGQRASARSTFALDAPRRRRGARARTIERFPTCRPIPPQLRDDCYEAYNIQVQGLAQRLQATGTEKAVIGVSGGLDSTQALIVAARAMDQLGLPRSEHARLHAARLRAPPTGTKATPGR